MNSKKARSLREWTIACLILCAILNIVAFFRLVSNIETVLSLGTTLAIVAYILNDKAHTLEKEDMERYMRASTQYTDVD